MNILGFNSVLMDAAVALVRGGRVASVLEEERFTRKKHDGSFPVQALQATLRMSGLRPDELDALCCSFDPWKAVRARSRALIFGGQWGALFRMAYRRKGDFAKTLSTEGHLRSALGLRRSPKVHAFGHHDCHAASTFFVSPFEKAAVLVMDSSGEDTAISCYRGRGEHLRKLWQLPFGQSLGALYTSVTEYLGFRPNSAEGKIMGLASYGEPEFLDLFERIVRLEEGGKVRLDLSFLTHQQGLGIHCSQRFINALGPSRTPETPIAQRHMNIAASLQKRLEDASLHMARHLHQTTKENDLCLTGGVTLNSVMNGRLLEESGFHNIYLIPAPGDAGTSLGAALMYYHQIKRRPRHYVMRSPFLGCSYSPEDIQACLDRHPELQFLRSLDIARDAAKLLSQRQILGWFQGRFEFGPRALGHRSILADPRAGDMKDTLNARVKFRESFRPFAPAVLFEKRAEIFTNAADNPFMLFVFKVREKMRPIIPAVVHVDQTGRGQTVSQEMSPMFWRLIHAFDEMTGVPVVLNTSFNIRGEPIINTPEEAITCYLKTGIDYLCLGPYLIWKAGKRDPKELL